MSKHGKLLVATFVAVMLVVTTVATSGTITKVLAEELEPPECVPAPDPISGVPPKVPMVIEDNEVFTLDESGTVKIKDGDININLYPYFAQWWATRDGFVFEDENGNQVGKVNSSGIWGRDFFISLPDRIFRQGELVLYLEDGASVSDLYGEIGQPNGVVYHTDASCYVSYPDGTQNDSWETTPGYRPSADAEPEPGTLPHRPIETGTSSGTNVVWSEKATSEQISALPDYWKGVEKGTWIDEYGIIHTEDGTQIDPKAGVVWHPNGVFHFLDFAFGEDEEGTWGVDVRYDDLTGKFIFTPWKISKPVYVPPTPVPLDPSISENGETPEAEGEDDRGLHNIDMEFKKFYDEDEVAAAGDTAEAAESESGAEDSDNLEGDVVDSELSDERGILVVEEEPFAAENSELVEDSADEASVNEAPVDEIPADEAMADEALFDEVPAAEESPELADAPAVEAVEPALG